jgi:HSP20 family protein
MLQTEAPVKTETRAMRRPFAFLDEMKADVERFFEKGWAPWMWGGKQETAQWTPRIDAFEKDGNLVVKADLPGMKKEDVAVTLEEGALVLKGERKEEKEVKKEGYFRSECHYGSFYRRLPLAFKVEPEKILARFADGVLEVTLPMPPAEVIKGKEIPIS